MNNFLKDLTAFVGRRIDANKEQLAARLSESESVMATLNGEEQSNIREEIGNEAIYLIGLGDGIRLMSLLSWQDEG